MPIKYKCTLGLSEIALFYETFENGHYAADQDTTDQILKNRQI